MPLLSLTIVLQNFEKIQKEKKDNHILVPILIWEIQIMLVHIQMQIK